MSRTRLEWAQWLVKEHSGITAFIVDPSSKRPLGGHSWMIRNSSDPEQLAEWFEMTPGANWGAWLGENHVVIDLDVKHDTAGFTGINHFEAICLENGVADFRQLKTLMVETPSGGYHLYFKTPRPCANKNTFPNGIDARGAVGYVVGPGSEVKAGKWKVVDPDMPIINIPEFLLDYLVSPGVKDPNHEVPLIELDQPENIEQALAWLKGAKPAIAGNGGDDHTYDVCCYLRDFGISEVEALNLLNESGWNERCEPAWDNGELEVKIKNSYAFGQNRPGCKASTYKKAKLMACRPPGGWGRYIRQEGNLALVIDNDDPEFQAWRDSQSVADTDGDDEIPSDVYPTRPVADDRKPERRPFKLRSEAEQDAQPDIKWLIESVLQEKTSALFYGPENSLKSFLALDLVLSAAAGQAWASYSGIEGRRGYTVERPLTVIYVAGEGSQGVEKLRRPAWRAHHGITEPLPFYTVNEMPIFRNMDHVDELIAEIEAADVQPDIIVIDTMARALLGLNENSAQDIGLLIEATDKVKHRFECSVIAVHHTGHNEAHPRGSTANPAAFDARFKVKRSGNSLNVVLTNEKQKDAGEWSERVHFKGQEVEFKTPERVTHTSLVFTRVAPSADSTQEADPRLSLALKTISENQGKMPLSMNALADAMAHDYATEDLTDGELEKAKEAMRNFLRKETKDRLAAYAHKAGTAKNAPWVFEDRRKDRSAA